MALDSDWNCKNCKHWRPPVNKMGECLKTSSSWRDSIGAYNDDGEWEAGFYCGPDFGCVHFEKAKGLRFNKRGQVYGSE